MFMSRKQGLVFDPADVKDYFNGLGKELSAVDFDNFWIVIGPILKINLSCNSYTEDGDFNWKAFIDGYEEYYSKVTNCLR